MILGAKMTHLPRCLDVAEKFCPDQPHPKQVDEVLDLLAEAEQMERCFPDVPSWGRTSASLEVAETFIPFWKRNKNNMNGFLVRHPFFCGLLNDLLFLWQKSSHLLGILWLRPHWGCLLQYSDQSLCPASQLHRCLWGTPLSVPLDLGMPPPLPVARYWIGWSRGRYILIQLHLTQPWTQNSGDAFYRYFWGFDLYAYVSNCFRSSLAKTFVRLGWNHSKKQEIQRSYCNILQHRSLANLTMRSWMLQCVLVGPTKRGLVSRRVKYESALKMRFCTEWNDQERRWFQEKFAHV